MPLQIALVSPTDEPYVPAGQYVHAEAPESENRPAEQPPEHSEVTRPVAVPYLPAGQLPEHVAEIRPVVFP